MTEGLYSEFTDTLAPPIIFKGKERDPVDAEQEEVGEEWAQLRVFANTTTLTIAAPLPGKLSLTTSVGLGPMAIFQLNPPLQI